MKMERTNTTKMNIKFRFFSPFEFDFDRISARLSYSSAVGIAALGMETEYIMTCGQHYDLIDVAVVVDLISLAATAEALYLAG
jgi:hypothetical protein